MNKYAIVTDSASDLCKEYREANGVDYAQTMMSWKKEDGQNIETGASLDWDFISFKDFYNLLRGGTRVYTAQVTIQNYLDVFESHLKKGEDVLYVACSSGLSASLNIARMLVEGELKEKYPDRKVVVFDSLRAGMAQGMLVMLAVDLKNQGKTLEENVEILEKEPGNLIGSAPDILKRYIEIRGIGIVDVVTMYGASAYRDRKNIRLVCELEQWDESKYYDRLGLDQLKIKFFNTEISKVIIPVLPGRNISLLVESAALNEKLKLLGHNSAQEFVNKVNSKAKNGKE